MARQRGKESDTQRRSDPVEDPAEGLSGGMPELVRRALTLGLSGFFTTEETIRRALGDTLPRDWIDFAVDQSGRTRQELLDRVSAEIGRSLEGIDVAEVLSTLLEGRTIEVTARVRLAPADDDDDAPSDVKVRLEREEAD